MMFRFLLTVAVLFAGSPWAGSISAAEIKREFVALGDVEIHYREAGEGDVLLFVPGWTFSSEIFTHQLEGLSDSYRVLAIDPRGQGRSTKTLVGADYLTHAEDLQRFIEAKNLNDIVLIGWSFGCLETYGYVKLVGLDNLRAHVCIDLSPKSLSTNPEDWSEGPLDDIAGAYHQFMRTQRGQRDFVAWYADEVMVQRDLTADEMAWIVDQSLETSHLTAAALFASGMFSNNLPEAKLIDEKKIPSLNVVAEHWADVAKAYLAREMPNAKVQVFGGHMMFWEYPEKFNTMLVEFLEEAS